MADSAATTEGTSGGAPEAVTQIIQCIEKVPTLPAVIARILEVMENPKSNVQELTRQISLDQSLTARILKIVNSSYYGFPRQISTVSQGVVILGFNAVKSLALSASVVRLFGLEGGKEKEFDLIEFWKHSIGTGVIANMVGTRIKYPLPEECLVAGILHGIGKLVFDQYLHDRFVQAIQKAKKEKKTLAETERAVLGLDHCEAGALLARKWKLPLHLEESIRYYPHPQLAELNQTLAALVHVGDHVARKIRFGASGEAGTPKLSLNAMKILNIVQSDINTVFDNVDAELTKADDIVASLIA